MVQPVTNQANDVYKTLYDSISPCTIDIMTDIVLSKMMSGTFTESVNTLLESDPSIDHVVSKILLIQRLFEQMDAQQFNNLMGVGQMVQMPLTPPMTPMSPISLLPTIPGPPLSPMTLMPMLPALAPAEAGDELHQRCIGYTSDEELDKFYAKITANIRDNVEKFGLPEQLTIPPEVKKDLIEYRGFYSVNKYMDRIGRTLCSGHYVYRLKKKYPILTRLIIIFNLSGRLEQVTTEAGLAFISAISSLQSRSRPHR